MSDTKMIRVDEATHDDLRRVGESHPDLDSFGEVVEYLLSEHRSTVTLDEAIQEGIDYYDGVEHIACIYVTHLRNTRGGGPSYVDITVYTGDADEFEETVSHNPLNRLEVDTGEETVAVPYRVIGTFDGPKDMDTADGTCVYMAESVLGAEPVALDDGLDRLREKLAGTGEADE